MLLFLAIGDLRFLMLQRAHTSDLAILLNTICFTFGCTECAVQLPAFKLQTDVLCA